MTKENLLSFNVGPIYFDFLQSLKIELVEVLTADGRIKKDQLLVQSNFSNVELGSNPALKRSVKEGDIFTSDTLSDKITFGLKNRQSRVAVSIPLFDVQKISFKFIRSEEDDFHTQWNNKTVTEVLDNEQLNEVIISWLQEAELNEWAKKVFILREKQIVCEQY